MIFINYIDDTKACNIGVGVGLLIWLMSRSYLAGALAFGFIKGKDSANRDGGVRFFPQLKLGFPLI